LKVCEEIKWLVSTKQYSLLEPKSVAKPTESFDIEKRNGFGCFFGQLQAQVDRI